MNENQASRRICVFSRYQLSEQFDLAAEFLPMLENLCADNDVMHISFRNSHLPSSIPAGLLLAEMPLQANRSKPRDIIIKSLLMYLMLPVAAFKIRRFKPDLIFVSEILPLVALFLKIFCGCRAATAYGDWHVHNFLGRKWWIRPFLALAEWLERVECRTIEGLFCRASAARTRLLSWGIPDEHIRVVFDAPDLSAFYPQDQSDLRRRCGFNDQDIMLLYHGVMHQGKGLDLLVRCIADLHKEQLPVGLFMVGAGPELEPLKNLAKNLGIENKVHFTGWLKTIQEVGRFCNAADICVAMRTGAESNVHIIPGALLHSMACRKVVIAPDLPGILEVIRHGDNGFVFKADDAISFKSLVRGLLGKRGDWDRIAQNAEQDIHDRFSVSGAARKYADAISHFSVL
jgi:glycosyltransferase involved in cell wall biosynthesis